MPLSLTLHSHLWRSAALLIACQLPNQRSCKTTRLNWRSLFVIVIWSWQNGKQYFEEINVYFVINGDLFEKLVVCFWSKSHCYLEYKTWSIRHRPTGLCPNLRRQIYNKTRPKSVRRCSSQTYCHIFMEPKIFDTKMCKYGIFVAKICKYALIDSFQGYAAVLDSSTNCAALFQSKFGFGLLVTDWIKKYAFVHHWRRPCPSLTQEIYNTIQGISSA